ncbi:hypoxanthine phosphoribosyltransferase [Oenococcus sicerae]|uniref:Hypoxanthine phosphoribosyltransferase n=1 Tax=Oenococcus sicerae TaxID=2203724 RepID=A0AAJ1VN59_9LACO|nr:hypoxanthine phosphoribosyltransferase [Oenococcus sicerae]MDN6899869.1 hypoxanthine phosphoribosyltransferase [Oenococcus sicerae]QAS70553.1 hypoxanthine phosphoribosyltransferase [Oenococcus sicerae]
MNALVSHPAIKGVLATETDISAVVQRIADQLDAKFADSPRPLFISVLKGAAIFTTDLLRKMSLDVDLDYIDVKSYNHAQSTGNIRVTHDVDTDLTDRDVVIVDEIVDTGRTMKWLSDYFKLKGAKSVTLVALTDKRAARIVDVAIDYAGIQVPNEFLVGYGMDYNGYFRNLPVIAVIDTEKLDTIK